MTEYWKKNWDGWPLHSLIAFLSMLPFITNSYPLVMFIMNVIFWPSREAWQHNGYKNIWTLHRIIEWGAPIVASGGMLLW